jgi:DNA-binding SARP family transcriptional activator
MEHTVLSLRLLGEIEVVRAGERLTLPPSKKTRALLAYLAATARPHRRERLCSMFWEIPDDPRGALRWSLSRLRALVNEPARDRIVATRETVAFEPIDAEIDLAILRRKVAGEFLSLSVEQLEELAAAFRGEFLEGIDLPNLHDFQAWCLAEREDIRRLQVRILATLIGRLTDRPVAALPYARQLAQIDPFNEAARIGLLQLLMALGRHSEAEQHFEAAVRVFKELGGDAEIGLLRAWRELRERPRPVETEGPAARPDVDAGGAPATPAEPRADSAEADAQRWPLIGREAEWGRLLNLLDASATEGRIGVVLLTGEPGLGKSRLIEDLTQVARQRGCRTFFGRAYETERDHPYGPWIELFGSIKLAGVPAGENGSPAPGERAEKGAASARDHLFATLVQRIFDPSGPTEPVLLALDDVQWCDEASAGLLHYLVRTSQRRPLTVIIAAREGELTDNPAMLAVIRSLRHARLVEEIALTPLSRAATERLVRAVAPDIDPAPVAAQSGGNPLFALELARNMLVRPDELPRSLKELVRDRIDRLPAGAVDLLRWASVVGPSFAVSRLLLLLPLALDEAMERLEILERHALLRANEDLGGEAAYLFAHDLIHRAVYTGISEPRRRLMHLKIARTLHEIGDADEALAADIAHHAALGGDAGMAAAACVTAGRRSLRLFANAEAEAMARRGIRYAEALPEPERVRRMLELMQIEFLARRPTDRAQATARIETLAERALDHGCLEHARLGFHMLSYLRWEGGEWADARRDTLRAELVSRSADDRERVVAMAEAARCLAMLERDLGQAEALALEAKALAQRLGIEPDAIPDATGMLRLHQGEADEAAHLFGRARAVARRDGDRAGEFFALEHLVALEIQRGRFADAQALCADLIGLGEKLRDGSEAHFARALDAVCRAAGGDAAAEADLESALAGLRLADAKHRLAFTLTCAAELDIERGSVDRAQARVDEALHVANVLERPSDCALALALLARIAGIRQDREGRARHLSALREILAQPISRRARTAAEAELGLANARTADARRPRRRSGAMSAAR